MAEVIEWNFRDIPILTVIYVDREKRILSVKFPEIFSSDSVSS